MNKNSFSGLLMIAITVLTSCGQLDVKMHTTVHEDGSCEREITYSTVMSKEERDSLWQGDVVRLAQPIPECLNPKAIMGTHTEVNGDTVTTTFSHGFSSAEEMCKMTPLQLNGKRLQSKATFEKHFQWFYTEYTFREVFTCVGDTFKLPATNYADKDVVSFWFTGQPNLIQGLSGAEASEKLNEMEPMITKWLNDNLFKTCFDFISNHYDSIANPPVGREQFVALQDSLARKMLEGQDDILGIEPTDAFRDFFHSDAYAIFFDEESSLCKAMNEELASRWSILCFSVPYTLSMPGTIVDAGTGTIKDGVILYPLTGERLIPHDYVITATSRVTHIWAYVITILIILIAIGSLLYKRKK